MKSPPKMQVFGAILDLLALILLSYGVYAMTPIGTLTNYSLALAQGKDIAFPFSGLLSPRSRARVEERPLSRLSSVQRQIWHIDQIAKEHGVSELALSSAATVFGQCKAKECWLELPASDGVILRLTMQQWAAKVSALQGDFDGDVLLASEGAIVGSEQLSRAIARARDGGASAPNYVQSHEGFFTPGLRRNVIPRFQEFLLDYMLTTLHWPVSDAFPITSPFGPRVHPVLGTSRLHNGTDVGTPVGTEAYAPQAGKVSFIGRDAVSGLYLTLELHPGLKLTYCHLQSIKVSSGAWVKQGELVAKTGRSGRVTGAHLHYTMRLRGVGVDPTKYHQNLPGGR